MGVNDLLSAMRVATEAGYRMGFQAAESRALEIVSNSMRSQTVRDRAGMYVQAIRLQTAVAVTQMHVKDEKQLALNWGQR